MKDNYYLDNAATTWPKPEAVYTFMDRFFRDYGVNPGRAGHQMGVEAEMMVTQTRRLLAEFFGFNGDPHRVVFTQNATDSLNTAIMGLVNPGDHMIITRLEHNSVLRPANHLERDHGVSVSRIGRDANGYVNPQDIADALTEETRVVVVNHASNVFGSVQDLENIGEIVRNSNAKLIVDTCQTAGVLDIDMDNLGIDVLVFTGHKGLFGPMGIGGLIVGEGVDIRAQRVGGTGVDSISPFQPDVYPYHLEAGTPSIPGIAGLNAAQKWFSEMGREIAQKSTGETIKKLTHKEACRLALAEIHRVENAHIERLATAFRATKGVRVYGPCDDTHPRVATLSISVDGIPADQVGSMLDADFEVCVRPGLHCAPVAHEDEGTVPIKGTVRFSPGFFTDDEDIDRAIEGISELCREAAA
jgi:cysteine desulfurase / selenocysteine lyase